METGGVDEADKGRLRNTRDGIVDVGEHMITGCTTRVQSSAY